MCAGLLGPGCQILGIFATRSQVYGAHGCHLACVVPLLWRPGGPWNDPGTLGSTRKDTLRSRLGFSLIFGGFRDSILKVFWVPWTKKVYVFMFVSRFRFLMIFGSGSGCLGLQDQAFGKGLIATINFQRSWNSNKSIIHFA